jgi:hypothetical protein
MWKGFKKRSEGYEIMVLVDGHYPMAKDTRMGGTGSIKCK